MNNTNNNSNIPKKITARQLYLNSNYAKNNTSENEINQERLNREEELNEQRSKRMEQMQENFEKKMKNNTQSVDNQEDNAELLNSGFAGKIHFAKMKVTDNNLFQRLFNFSQTIIAQKIYCIIGVLLLGTLFNLATNAGNTTRSNFLIYCVWTWIYLLIALIVLNYVFKLVFQ